MVRALFLSGSGNEPVVFVEEVLYLVVWSLESARLAF